MAQHYYPLCWGREVGGAVGGGKQDGRKDVLGRARGWGSAELSAQLPGQIQRDGTTPVHGELSKAIARQILLTLFGEKQCVY